MKISSCNRDGACGEGGYNQGAIILSESSHLTSSLHETVQPESGTELCAQALNLDSTSTFPPGGRLKALSKNLLFLLCPQFVFPSIEVPPCSQESDMALLRLQNPVVRHRLPSKYHICQWQKCGACPHCWNARSPLTAAWGGGSAIFVL